MYLRALALAGLIAASLPNAMAAEPNVGKTSPASASPNQSKPDPAPDPYERVYGIVPSPAFEALSKQAGGADIRRLQSVRAGDEDLALLELRQGQLPTLRAVVNEVSPHSGMLSFRSKEDAIAYADNVSTVSQQEVVPYTIDQESVVNTWLSGVSEPRMRETISYLESSFATRYPSSTDGRKAPAGIKARWEALAAGRSDVKVELVDCSGCGGQPSVVMTLKGASAETVVLGAHLDTGVGVNGKSPGANENASGVAVLTEAIRVALSSKWVPQREVKFVAYAAQTTGLNGSKSLAQSFKSQGKVVIAVLGLDYTDYRPSGTPAMRQVSDNTYSGLNQFIQQLGARYLPTAPMVATPCGYACGDHASWTSAGFPAAALTGATWLPSNGTERDTLAELGNTAAPSVPFAQMALAFLAETSKGSIPDAPPLPTAAFGYKVEGLTVRFADQSTGGASTITGWNWQFGDGSSSAERNPVHAYAQAGRYDVTLRVVTSNGQDDETKQVVVDAVPVDGVLVNYQTIEGLAGDAGSERYWTMTVPADAMALKFVASNGTGDVDLYVKRGARPTTSSYDCRPYRLGNEEVCELPDSGGGTYHVMLRGYKPYAGVSLMGKYLIVAGRKTYANEADLPIPDQGVAVESAIVVAGRDGNPGSETRVQVDIKHSYIGDLIVELVAPDGTPYVLHNRTGGSSDNLSVSYSINVSAKPLNGTWNLRVRDMSHDDTGELDRWSITF